jgi:presenilin 1
MGRSILDDLGQEVTGIAAPVSICMALTVILVRVLNPEGESDSGAVYLASVYYREDVSEQQSFVFIIFHHHFLERCCN